jgi:hypothetical protein
MKLFYFLVFCCMVIYSCNNGNTTAIQPTVEKKDTLNFFPVTAYLKGQIAAINQSHKNPLMFLTIGNKTDSVWLKMEDLPTAFSEFLKPTIDSTNLINFYTEKRFLDRSINAFTFTYEKKSTLPDSMNLKKWDVYITPETGTVKRVYLVKEIKKNETLQLTWINDMWCKMVWVTASPNGDVKVLKEQKIVWGY